MASPPAVITRGNVYTLTATFTDVGTGNPVDPSSVLARFQSQQESVPAHTPSVTRVSTGVYTYLFDSALLPAVPSQLVNGACYTPDGDPHQGAHTWQTTVVDPGGIVP